MEVAPNAKIMFYNHSVDVLEIVERWFGAGVGYRSGLNSPRASQRGR